jgi:hypothetical protein
MQKKKTGRGGKREGAGAKPKYNEATKTIAFRVPESNINEVKALVNKMLTTYRKNTQ